MIFVLIFVSCSDDDKPIVEYLDITVNHYLVTEYIPAEHLEYLIKIGDEENFNRQISEIENFDFEDGYVYELSVLKEYPDPELVGSKPGYSLLEEKSKSKVAEDTQFKITLKNSEGASFVKGNVTTGFTILDLITVTCETEDVCTKLQESLENDNKVIGTFTHAENGAYNLIGIDVD